ncbi:aminoglycoside phosphotransferase family protein [Kineosporia sp. J2-2]|uniref:Aminoglycoside phosphotransferase family protein n=1 Tax=Kineosporia corallincola TaxID=2835133 RepID=A0ABS5TF74_9ACTN|nr:aminoglycoside phosphotransferase family protein [Kineosporia corallincola]MBT0769493.1 aminoglycoside phosphotransferase family protein [Kineosporia corallincola]
MISLRTAVVARTLYLLRLHLNGEVTELPAGPGHRARTVLRVPVLTAAGGTAFVVIKFAIAPGEAAERSLEWEHEVTLALYEIARHQVKQGALPYNPIPEPLAERLLRYHLVDRFVPGAGGPVRVVVSARHFVEPSGTPFTARALGRLIAHQHVLGATDQALRLLATRPTNLLCGLDARRFAQALSLPGHPFQARTTTVRALLTALRERAVQAVEAGPEPLLVHRDMHPLNCVPGPAGPVSLDWAEAGWGGRADDFAWLHLAVARHGAPARVLDQALAGYAEVLPGRAPTPEQVRATGRLRELVCLAFSVMHADRSPAHLHEALRELPVLADPDAPTPRWSALYNPEIFEHPLFAPSTQGGRKAS